MYSKMFYPTRLKEKIDPIISKLPISEQMAKRAKMTMELYAAESDEIKLAVKKELEERNQKLKDGREMLSKLVEPSTESLDRDEVAKSVVILILR